MLDQVLSMHQNGDHGCAMEADPSAKNVTTTQVNKQPAKTFISNNSQTYVFQIYNKVLEITEKYKNDTDKKIRDTIVDSFSMK